MEVEENATRELDSSEEEKSSQPKSQDQDTDVNELGRGPGSSTCENDKDKDWTTDPRDEYSVTRELYEHVLDYDEAFPENSFPAAQEVEAEKPGAEDIEHKGVGAPREEENPGVKNVEEKESLEAAKEGKKEDDDGENDNRETDEDLEEGEVREPSDRKVRPRPTCQFFMKEVVPPLSTLFAPISYSLPFRSQVKGNCIWGMNCKSLHPGVNDKGNHSMISKADPPLPNSAPPLRTHSLMPASGWRGRAIDDILPPPPPQSPTQSAWERGLRNAKEVLKKANIGKVQETGFEEKRFTVTVGEDEREFHRQYQITRDTAPEPYADPHQDYDIEWFWRGGQYENYRVHYTEREPYPNVLERERQRQRERKVEQKRDREREGWPRESEHEHQRQHNRELQRRKEEWERERAKWDQRNRQHRDRHRDKERVKDKEKPKSWSRQPPSCQAEPPKKASTAGPQVKRADEWKDPWRRSKTPMKKLWFSVPPNPARRGRKTSASSTSSTSASNSSRSSSGSSSSSASGSSRSRSRSSSCNSYSSRSSRHSGSSYSSRSSRHSRFSGSRSRSGSSSSSPSPTPTPSRQRPTLGAKGVLAPPPRRARKKLMKNPAPLPASALSIKTPASAPKPTKPAKPRESPEVRRKEQLARRPPRKYTRSDSNKGRSCCRNSSGSSSRSRSSSVTSISSVSSTTWSSCSMHSVDLEDMYRDQASPRPSTSSRSLSPAQAKKEKEKPQKEDDVKENKQKMNSSSPAPKSGKRPAGTRSSQQPSAIQQAPLGQPPAGAFIARKEIKLILLNQVTDERSRKQLKLLEKDRQCPPAKRVKTSPERDSHHRKSGGRLGSPTPERERRQNPTASLAQPDRKHQGSPSQPRNSSKVTIVPGIASASGTNSGSASRLSRRKELLKQLKAVEDAIEQQLAKIQGKGSSACCSAASTPPGIRDSVFL